MADAAATTTTTTTTNETTTNNDSTQEQNLNLVNHKSKYIITTFSLIAPEFKDPIILNPAAINKVTVIQDFDNFIQPIFKIECVLPPLIVDYITQHKAKISFYIRFDMISFSSAADNLKIAESYPTNVTKTICDGVFVTFNSDSSLMPNRETYHKVTETVLGKEDPNLLYDMTEAGSNMVNYTKEYGFYLWKESDLYGLREVVNAVYSGTTPADASTSMLSDNGFKDVIMFPPDANTSYDQMVIPPMSMMNVFKFMQSQYGMYETDSIFFCDIMRPYLIDKSGECKAYAQGEYPKVIFDVVKTDSEYSVNYGTSTLDAKNEYHNMIDVEDTTQRSLSSIYDILVGNNPQMVEARNNKTTNIKGAGQQRGDGCTSLTTDQEGNAYNKAKIANMIAELNLNLKIDYLPDYDYTVMTPNRTYVFAFKEKEFYLFDGYYRLLIARHFFVRHGTEMHIVGQFEFARKKTLSEDEKNEIEYDVFRTAQTSDEKKEEAKGKAEENNKSDPSFKQSQTGRGMEAGGTYEQASGASTTAGSSAPGAVTDAAKTNTNSAQVFSTKDATASTSTKSTTTGSSAPTPIDQRIGQNPLSGSETVKSGKFDLYIMH